jgi:hypothetical protein
MGPTPTSAHQEAAIVRATRAEYEALAPEYDRRWSGYIAASLDKVLVVGHDAAARRRAGLTITPCRGLRRFPMLSKVDVGVRHRG